METGYRGAFVISWSQTELEGLTGSPIEALAVGAVWSWRGEVTRVDGPNGVLRLDKTDGKATNRRAAAKLVRRLVSAAKSNKRDLDRLAEEDDTPLAETGFVVTDGLKTYAVTVTKSKKESEWQGSEFTYNKGMH